MAVTTAINTSTGPAGHMHDKCTRDRRHRLCRCTHQLHAAAAACAPTVENEARAGVSTARKSGSLGVVDLRLGKQSSGYREQCTCKWYMIVQSSEKYLKELILQ